MSTDNLDVYGEEVLGLAEAGLFFFGVDEKFVLLVSLIGLELEGLSRVWLNSTQTAPSATEALRLFRTKLGSKTKLCPV